MKNKQSEAIEILEKYNQHHIVEHMEKLKNEEKEKLIEQIKETDFEEIINLYNKTKMQREKRNIKIQPLQTIIANQMEQTQKKEYIEQGEKILKENRYAVVTMAGGQGTRLRTLWTKR